MSWSSSSIVNSHYLLSRQTSGLWDRYRDVVPGLQGLLLSGHTTGWPCRLGGPLVPSHIPMFLGGVQRFQRTRVRLGSVVKELFLSKAGPQKGTEGVLASFQRAALGPSCQGTFQGSRLLLYSELALSLGLTVPSW